MPYKIKQGHWNCPVRRPWGVIKGNGDLMGCHSSEEKAQDQVDALYANEPEASSGELRGAVAPHDTSSESGEWDATANTSRLPSPMSVDMARRVYAWYDSEAVEDGQIHKEDAKLPHHFVDSDGNPGAASVNGVRNALSRLPQTEGLSESERDTIERHLNNHLPDEDDDEQNSAASPPSVVTRAVPFELSDAQEDDDGLTLTGYAAVFDSPTRIDSMFEGTFDEVIAPGAFKRTLSARKPVLQFDHGSHPMIGGMPLGRYDTLREDAHGLYVEARLSDNWMIQPVRDAIRDGAITGMSFRFSVPEGKDEWQDRRGAVRLRTIREVKLYEAGPVVFPAYDSTSVDVRARRFAAELADPDFRAELARALLTGTSDSGLADGTPDSELVDDDSDSQQALRGSSEQERASQLRALALETAGVISGG